MFQAAVQQWLPSAGLDKLSNIAESPQAQQMKAHASKALQRCSSPKHAAVAYTTTGNATTYCSGGQGSLYDRVDT